MKFPKFSYQELAQIRDLCKDKRFSIWREKYMHNFPKDDIDRIQKAFTILIEEDKNQFSVVGRCNTILDKIQEFDEEIKKELAKQQQ